MEAKYDITKTELLKVKNLENMNRKKVLSGVLLIIIALSFNACQKKICPTFKLETIKELVK